MLVHDLFSNIVAALDKSSTEGLFPPPDISLPVIRWPANTEDYSDPQQAFLLVPSVGDIIQTDVHSSDLLSRGWVQQEVFLSPANLFCTRGQIYWSCSTTTCSQNFPTSVPDLDTSNMIVFHDSLGVRKRISVPSARADDTMEAWEYFLIHYIQTSVTVADDRLPAIAGIAAAFASRPQFHGAVCHSGVWNSGGWSQALRWRGRLFQGCATRRLVTHRPIPSWSPLSCVGRPYPVTFFSPRQQEADVRYSAKIDVDVSELDQVGRVKTLKGCRMYIRAVLLEMPIRNEDLYLEHKGQTLETTTYWDTTEDLDWARLRMDDRIHILVWEVRISEPLVVVLQGLLLKPNARPFEHHEDEAHGRVWQRCGRFDGYFSEPTHDLRLLEDALQLRRFGISLDHLENGHLRIQSTGEAVDLEDICIV